jgi:thioredoxin 1
MKKILYFTAAWCGPCKAMAPIITEVLGEGLMITKVDVDSNPGLATQYNIKSIPTFVLVENENEIMRKAGVQSKESLKQLFNS